jgi:hypothetical protein
MSAPDLKPLPFRWYISVAAVLLVFVVVGVYSSRMAHDTTGYDDDQATARLAKLTKMRATEHKTLTTADWIDSTKGTVHIPIDEAMVEEVGVLQAKQPAMGSAIVGIPPVTPAPPSAPTGTNSPAATPAPATNAPAASTNSAPAAPASATNAAPAGAAPSVPASNPNTTK